MNVGILTFHNADNYGSVLQAYALKTFVEEIDGVDYCEIVNYLPPNQEELYSVYVPINSVKNIIKNIRAFFFKGLLFDRKKEFSDFRKNRLGIQKHKSTFLSEEDRKLKEYDAVIVGSDQIWNPRSTDFSIFYFVPEFNGKKIAYAPSFGNATVEDFKNRGIESKVSEALKLFHVLSVREKSGVSIIKELAGKSAIEVVDPTLLISDKWNQIASDSGKNAKYIFFYAIDYNFEAIKMVQKISKKIGLPVKVIFSTNKTYRIIGKGFELVKVTAPEDFIGLIKNATLVLSSSFHGTAFSVIFEKNFYALEAHRNGVLYKDQRIHGLLSRIGLEDRIITDDDIDCIDFSEHVLFDRSMLDAVIEESKSFIISALKE